MYVGIVPCALQLLFTPVSAISSVILMLRTYAFSGRKKAVLAILSIAFFGLAGVIIWVTSQKLTRLFLRLRLSRRVFLTLRLNRSVVFVPYFQSRRLFRHFGSTDFGRSNHGQGNEGAY